MAKEKPADKSKWAAQAKAEKEGAPSKSKDETPEPPAEDDDPTGDEKDREIEASKKSRGKQDELPGFESTKCTPVETAAENYAEARDKRIDWGIKEGELLDKLVAKMNEHSLKKYRRGPILVELRPGKTKAKVRTNLEDKKADD
jgi:hypothetical protein